MSYYEENSARSTPSPFKSATPRQDAILEDFTPKSNFQSESSNSSLDYELSASQSSNFRSEDQTPFSLNDQVPLSSHRQNQPRESSFIPTEYARDKIKKVGATQIEYEMLRMHQRHCQLLKDMDDNYAAIERETHQRYVEFIHKWKDQIKLKIDQYKRVIEGQKNEISDIRLRTESTVGNLQEKINRMSKEKNEILTRLEQELDEKEQNKENAIKDVRASYEKEIRSLYKDKQEMQYKLEELASAKINADKFNEQLLQSLTENDKYNREILQAREQELEELRSENQSLQAEIVQVVLQDLIGQVEHKFSNWALAYREEVKRAQEVKKKKMLVKRKINEWNEMFEQRNGRKATAGDKQEIKHLYSQYQIFNKEFTEAQSNIEELKNLVAEKRSDSRPRTPLGRSQSPNNSLNISIESVNTPRGSPGNQHLSVILEKARNCAPDDAFALLSEELANAFKEIQRIRRVAGSRGKTTPRGNASSLEANSIIVTQVNHEIKEIRAERDSLRQELEETRRMLEQAERGDSGFEERDSLQTQIASLKDQVKGLQLKNQQLEEECKALRAKFAKDDPEKLKKQLQEISEKFRREQRELEGRTAHAVQQYEAQVKGLMQDSQRLREEFAKVSQQKEKELEALKQRAQESLEAGAQLKIIQPQLQEVRQQLMIREQDLKDSFRQRKLLHNQLEDLKGKIRVFCRVRPMNQDEIGRRCTNIVTISDEFTINCEMKPGEIKEFSYDAVFGPNALQEEVFEDSRRLVQSAVDGFNVCIFAYGQTGSGKTFTMQGEQGNLGITPRAINELFDLLEMLPGHLSYKVSCYMVELYMDNIVDLFRSRNEKAVAKSLAIKKDNRGMVYIPDARKFVVSSREELQQKYDMGIEQRHVGSTRMNDVSSRSHLVFSVLIEVTNEESGQRSLGKLSLVDLAGSEKMAKTEATQIRLAEAKAVNRSLMTLGSVISSLSTGESYVSYRDNKLTMLMQDSLGGSAKTLMIVNVSPASYNREETLSSLHYAARVKMITNEPVKRVESREISILREEISRLEAENLQYRVQLERGDSVQQNVKIKLRL